MIKINPKMSAKEFLIKQKKGNNEVATGSFDSLVIDDP